MVSFVHSTRAQLAQGLRQRLRERSGLPVGRVCRWLLANLSDAELRAMFGVTSGQLPTLKSRLQAKADALAAAENIQGGA